MTAPTAHLDLTFVPNLHLGDHLRTQTIVAPIVEVLEYGLSASRERQILAIGPGGVEKWLPLELVVLNVDLDDPETTLLNPPGATS